MPKFLTFIGLCLMFLTTSCANIMKDEVANGNYDLLQQRSDTNSALYIICQNKSDIELLQDQQTLRNLQEVQTIYNDMITQKRCHPFDDEYAAAMTKWQRQNMQYNITKVINAKMGQYQVMLEKTNHELYAMQVDWRSPAYMYLTIVLNNKIRKLKENQAI